MVEAEEQVFARVDGAEQSGSLIQAALYALSPNFEKKSSSNADASRKKSTSSSDDGVYIPTIWSGNTDRIYQYCLLGNFDDSGKERASKRLCVAIQKKKKDFNPSTGGWGDGKEPAKGVCRITLTLSPGSVLAKKKLMATEREGNVECQSSSEVHRKIRESLRILRPPKLTTVGSDSNNDVDVVGDRPAKRRRQALRRRSITQLIDHTMIVVGVRCQHELLLDTDEVGKMYVNGALAVDCSSSSDALPAHTLFGVDFTLPSSNPSAGLLPKKIVLEREYGALLVDALIDAGQCDADVAGKLLCRLISANTDQDTEDDYDDSSSKSGDKGKNDHRYHDQFPRTESNYSIQFDDISHPCLESIVLSSTVVDPVGIGAKAVGTKFRLRYGKEAFPCEIGTSDAKRLHRILGAQKIAISVPRRARGVLLRGDYLSIDRMATLLWGSSNNCGSYSSWDGDHGDAMRATAAMEGAIKLLRRAGCRDVKPNKIRFVARKKLDPVVEQVDAGHNDTFTITSSSKCPPSRSKLRCWYDSGSGSYYVSDAILFVEEDHERENDGDVSVNSGAVSTAKNSKSGADEETSNRKSRPSIGEQDDATNKESGDSTDCAENIHSDEKDGGSKAVGKENMGDKSKKKETKDETANTEVKAGDGEEKPKSTVGKMDDVDGKPKSDTDDVKEDFAVASTKPDNISMSSPNQTKTSNGKQTRPRPASAEDVAYLLAFYIAKEHPDAMVLERFVTCHRS
mmetsp:Transcript_16612/g.30162  ORF Transcript_16612/g.30162 Transcript_16612/m.30162 type:complete len:739 (+) Transcript_16612:1894-4110(+)